MMKRILYGLCGCGMLVLTSSSCSDIKYSTATKLQYMPDMADSPTVKAQENYIDPPEYSVSTNAIIYPEDMTIAENEFRNPIRTNETVLASGKKLFGTYCAVCHGVDGKGQGTVSDKYPKSAVPDISRADLASRKDGFFFMKISKGGPMMPGYGYATTREERWHIVHHLRTLQNGSN